MVVQTCHLDHCRLFRRGDVERVTDFDTAGGRSLGSEFGFFERRKWKASE